MPKVSVFRRAQLDEQAQKYVALYKTGMSTRGIAKVFHVSHTTVFNAIKRAKLNLPTG